MAHIRTRWHGTPTRQPTALARRGGIGCSVDLICVALALATPAQRKPSAKQRAKQIRCDVLASARRSSPRRKSRRKTIVKSAAGICWRHAGGGRRGRHPALSAFLRNLDDEAPEPVEHEHIDEPAGQRPSHEIHFERFKKLHEFYVVEKIIEVYAPLRGEQGSRPLRLEALRSPQEHGYQVAVYRQIDVPVASLSSTAGQEGTGGHVVHLWVPYDLIRSVRSTAEKALEQVMGFRRCGAIRATNLPRRTADKSCCPLLPRAKRLDLDEESCARWLAFWSGAYDIGKVLLCF